MPRVFRLFARFRLADRLGLVFRAVVLARAARLVVKSVAAGFGDIALVSENIKIVGFFRYRLGLGFLYFKLGFDFLGFYGFGLAFRLFADWLDFLGFLLFALL